jgi:hypothetical protein
VASFDELRAEVLAIAGDVLSRTRERSASEAADRLRGEIARLREGKLTVLVCGEHSQGKSRLLNAYLDEPGLLPVDSHHCTRLITTISYGPAEEVAVLLSDDAGRTSRKIISRDQIGRYATEAEHGATSDTASDASGAVVVEVALPHPKLAGGRTFVDTPGVGGGCAEHSAMVKEFLPHADAVLFVSSFEAPLPDTELDFLAQAAAAVRAAEHPDSLLFVLTKADRQADPVEREALLATARQRLADATGRLPSEIVILPVSSATKELATGADRADGVSPSGFPDLERALDAQLGRHRAALLLGGTLEQTRATVEALRDPLRQAQEAQQATNAQAIATIREQLAADRRRLDELDTDESLWRQNLERELAKLNSEFVGKATDGVDRVWARAESDYLHREDYLTEPRRLADELTAQIGMAISAVDEWATERAAAIQRRLVTTCGLPVSPAPFAQLPPPRVRDLSSYRTLRPRHRADWPPPAASSRDSSLGWRTGIDVVSTGMDVVSTGMDVVGTGMDVVSTGIDVVSLGGVRRRILKPTNGVRDAIGETIGLGGIARRILNPAQRVRDTTFHDGRSADIRDKGIPAHILDARQDELRSALAEDRERVGRDIRDSASRLVGDYAEGITEELASLIRQERERVAESLPLVAAALQATTERSAAKLVHLLDQQVPLDEAAEQLARLCRDVEKLCHSPAADDTAT